MNIYKILTLLIFLFFFISGFFAFATFMQMILDRKKISRQLKCSPLLANSWTGADVTFVILFFIVASYVAGVIPTCIINYLSDANAPTNENLSIVEYSFYLSSNFLLIHLPGIFLCIMFVTKLHRQFIYRLPNIDNTTIKNIKYGCLCFVRIIAPVMLTSLISGIVLKQFGYDVQPQEILIAFTQSDSLLINIYIAVIAIFVGPIFEELIFRGILFQYVLKYTSIPVAVFAVSAVFAGIHGHIPSFMPIFVLGCGLSLAYLKSGSIVVPITMHVLFNALNLILLTIVTKFV
jgi:membrane protease YdiL (CAAX protease family)